LADGAVSSRASRRSATMPSSAARRSSRSGTYDRRVMHRRDHRGGECQAAVAVGHSILVICWHLITNDTDYHDLGGDYFYSPPRPRPPSRPAHRAAPRTRLPGHPRTRRMNAHSTPTVDSLHSGPAVGKHTEPCLDRPTRSRRPRGVASYEPATAGACSTRASRPRTGTTSRRPSRRDGISPPAHKLVGEGTRDAEDLARFLHGHGQPLMAHRCLRTGRADHPSARLRRPSGMFFPSRIASGSSG
jgi:hypothetical protein